jgi:hypothetical protein
VLGNAVVDGVSHWIPVGLQETGEGGIEGVYERLLCASASIDGKCKREENLMIIAVFVAAIATVCLSEVARRAYVGRHMAENMRRHEPPSTIRILGTAEELQSALRRVSEAERLRAREADQRADHYVAVADAVMGSGEARLAGWRGQGHIARSA